MRTMIRAAVRYWHLREALRRLRSMDDRLFADMGFTREALRGQLLARMTQEEGAGQKTHPVRPQSRNRPLSRTACSAASTLANT